MKTNLCLFSISLLILAFISCEKDEVSNDNTFESQELDSSLKSTSLTSLLTCTIDGPDCGNPNSTVTFTYDSDTNNQNINWSVAQGNMNLTGGQGTNQATFSLASNFSGGAVNVTAGLCNLTKTILKCPPIQPCGVSITGVYEVNALGSDNVAFYTVPTLSSGWSITSSTFVVTRNSGIISTHSGTLNPNGLPQIIIPVLCSPSSGRVDKVKVTVNASSGSNSCSVTIEQDFFSVCGTGGFN